MFKLSSLAIKPFGLPWKPKRPMFKKKLDV